MTGLTTDLSIMKFNMKPVLIRFHAPVHDLDPVAQHAVREGLPGYSRAWQRGFEARERVYRATGQRVVWRGCQRSERLPRPDHHSARPGIRGRTLIQTQLKPNPNEEAVHS